MLIPSGVDRTVCIRVAFISVNSVLDLISVPTLMLSYVVMEANRGVGGGRGGSLSLGKARNHMQYLKIPR